MLCSLLITSSTFNFVDVMRGNVKQIIIWRDIELDFQPQFYFQELTVLSVVMFSVSHRVTQIPAVSETLCPVVIRSISENFCDYHGTWLFPGSPGAITDIFRNGWLPRKCRDKMSPVGICDTVRHRKHYHRLALPSVSTVCCNLQVWFVYHIQHFHSKSNCTFNVNIILCLCGDTFEN